MEITRRRFLPAKEALIPATGKNRSDQRMPPGPATGFILPSGISARLKPGSDAPDNAVAVARVYNK